VLQRFLFGSTKRFCPRQTTRAHQTAKGFVATVDSTFPFKTVARWPMLRCSLAKGHAMATQHIVIKDHPLNADGGRSDEEASMMCNANKAASGNDVERQSPGAEARAIIEAPKDACSKYLRIMGKAAINAQAH
jgi:hypothetical protein